MAGGLTDEAREELAEAVRIVREDRFSRHAYSILQGFQKPADEGGEKKEGKDGKDPKNPDPKDPPRKDNNPADEKPKRGLWSVGYEEESA